MSVRVGCLILFLVLAGSGGSALAQSDARQRQAAAEAYDQGTAAYVALDYEKAAQWFETANRLSPAAPALIQAARAHQQAGNLARAATLALRLVETYPDDPTASDFGNQLLNDLSGKFVRVDVDCQDCALDVDGTLEESHSFFVEPDTPHSVTASFETGEQHADVSGSAGETKELSFTAPPRAAPIEAPIPEPEPQVEDTGGAKPLKPIFTYVGIGVTAALVAGSIVSTLDVYSGVDAYESAAKDWRNQCVDTAMPADQTTCDGLKATAKSKYDSGHSKETRTTVLWVATGLVGAATAVVGLALTDWAGNNEQQEGIGRRFSFAVGPTKDGAAMSLRGRF